MGQAQDPAANRGASRVPRRRRVLIGDVRNNGSYLRTTWHVEGRMFVVSTWNDQVCTGAIRLPVDGAAELVGLLADGLAEAAVTPSASASPATATTTATGSRGVLSLRRDLQAWVDQARNRLGRMILGRSGGGLEPDPPPPSQPARVVADDDQRWTA
jgi:hypothetical protein